MSDPQRRQVRRASSCSRSCATASASCSPRTSIPTATRSARSPAMQQVLVRAGQGRRLVHVRRRVPAALRVPLPRAAAARDLGARRRRRAHGRLPGLRQHRPQPGRRAQARARASSTSTTTTTTRASARSTTSCPDASCTAEVVWDLMRDARRAARRQPIAEALYVGLVTDTGRFMYENTGARAHVMAAELIAAGVDVHAIYRRLYEGVPQAKLELLARGADRRRALRRRAADASRTSRARTTRPTGRGRELLRGRRRPPARASRARRWRRSSRDLLSDGARAARKVSLRATDDRVDVSRDRARAGRRRAPPRRGLLDRPGVPASSSRSCARSSPSSFERSRSRWTVHARSDGVLLVDKPAGDDVARRRRGRARARLRRGIKVGHAGTLDPFATGLLLVLVGRATRVQRFLMALPKRYEARRAAGLDVDHRRPRGRDRAGADAARAAARCPPARCASARRPTRRSRSAGERAYALARAGEAVELPEREVDGAPLRAARRDGRPRRVRDRVLARAPTCARSIADLGDAYCLELRRTRDRPVRRRRRRRASCRSTTRSRFLPAVELAARTRAPGGPRRARSPGARRGHRAAASTTTGPSRSPSRARTARSSPS